MFFECICGMAKLSRSLQDLQDPFWTCHIFILVSQRLERALMSGRMVKG